LRARSLLFVVASQLLLSGARAAPLTPADVRAITKQAYIYGYPMVDGYRIQHAYFVDRGSPDYKAPYNRIVNFARVFTPADSVVQTPNADTPYSFVGLDLRAEPIVLTVPPIENGRYFSIQLVDAYTFNFDYIGSRTTGSGSFLIVGPQWKGRMPAGIKKIFRSETELALAIYRTQLFAASDVGNVQKIQAGYKVQPLSAFLARPAPPAATAIDFFRPLARGDERTSLEFFNELNFVLAYCPTDPSERALMARFARIGVGAGKTIDAGKLSPAVKKAMQDGVADAWATFAEFKTRDIGTGKVTSSDVFGNRASLKNNYLYRMAAAVLGIYGNSAQEAMYPGYSVDARGRLLDGTHRYTVRFASGQLPPVNAFWSLTMYKLPSSLLVANSIDRYLVNSAMLPQFKRDADGGITFYVQAATPGPGKEANWLPAPDGPFVVYLRLYWPKAAALDGKWKQPPMIEAE
jgi:hypothetical protein